jgi:hypothetical protein
MEMSKKAILFIFMILFVGICVFSQNAVCTPVSCPDPENNGELNPDELEPAMIGEPYHFVLSVLPPPESSGFTINRIQIDQIDNMPGGFNWETNSNNSNDYLYNGTWYCVVIQGLPTGPAGVYEMTVWANAWINSIFGPIAAPGNPQNGGTLTSVVCNPIHPWLGNDTVLTFGDSLVLDATHPGYASYLWSDSSIFPTLTLFADSLGIGTHSFTVAVSDSTGTMNGTAPPYCVRMDTIQITVPVPTDLNSSLDRIVIIYPNPAKDHIIISSEFIDLQRAEIRTFNGQLIQTYNYLEGYNVINLDNLPNGIYLLSVFTSKGVKNHKLIRI